MAVKRTRAGVRKAERKRSATVTELPPANPPLLAGEGRVEAAPATTPPPAAEEAAETRAGSCADTPLEYMLRVMRDPAVKPVRRDEMAKLALPYLHPKPTAIEHTGKDGGPIEISGVSPTDVARRIGFIMAQGGQLDAAEDLEQPIAAGADTPSAESKDPGERPGSPRGMERGSPSSFVRVGDGRQRLSGGNRLKS